MLIKGSVYGIKVEEMSMLYMDTKEGSRVDNITWFDPATANKAHAGTILASDVLPKGMNAPFEHAWCYLSGPGEIEPHTHHKEEVYLFIR